MIWVVGALTVVVSVLALFVLGLLRSHAEIRSRIRELESSPRTAPPSEPPTFAPGLVEAPDEMPDTQITRIEGVDSDLEPATVVLRELPTTYLLVAFLSTGCLTCLDIWRDMIEAGEDSQRVTAGGEAAAVILILKSSEYENLGKARALANETSAQVLFSADAWNELEVPGSPYFALLRNTDGSVVGAGSAQSWEQLKSLASDGMLELAVRGVAATSARGYRSIIEREDADLARAGIRPEHPSLSGPIVSDEHSTPDAAGEST
jgi:hypothetical protein